MKLNYNVLRNHVVTRNLTQYCNYYRNIKTNMEDWPFDIPEFVITEEEKLEYE